jgi:DNA replication protein DnaC
VRAPRLFRELHVARGDGSYLRVLARLAKIDLVAIDDLGLAPLTSAERHDLLELLEDRTERASTLITSQVPVKGWHEVIGDPTLADAICDRLVHSAYMIDLQGPSLRDPAVRGQAGPAPPSETGPAEATESSPPKPPRPRKRG